MAYKKREAKLWSFITSITNRSTQVTGSSFYDEMRNISYFSHRYPRASLTNSSLEIHSHSTATCNSKNLIPLNILSHLYFPLRQFYSFHLFNSQWSSSWDTNKRRKCGGFFLKKKKNQASGFLLKVDSKTLKKKSFLYCLPFSKVKQMFYIFVWI